MYRLIEFFNVALINNKIILNTTNEICRWSLIERLNQFQRRIPSIWNEINKNAILLLDHPSEDVRFKIAKLNIYILLIYIFISIIFHLVFYQYQLVLMLIYLKKKIHLIQIRMI